MLDNLVSAGFGLGFAAAPKVLGDLFEAIAGAVLVDCGNDLETLWKVTSDHRKGFSPSSHVVWSSLQALSILHCMYPAMSILHSLEQSEQATAPQAPMERWEGAQSRGPPGGDDDFAFNTVSRSLDRCPAASQGSSDLG